MCVSPSDCATLLVVDLDELAEAAGVVVVSRLSVSKGLRSKWKRSARGQVILTGTGVLFSFHPEAQE